MNFPFSINCFRLNIEAYRPFYRRNSQNSTLNFLQKMDTIIVVLLNAVSFFVAARLLSGVKLNGFVQAIFVAVAIAILNVTLGFLLKIVTLGILSLGVFTLLLDAILIQVADYFLKDFEVKNFWWALLLALVVSLIDGLIGWVL